jgi:hypothetical protein
MPVVSTVDYVNKRIYLHADTVGVDLDTMDVYREVRSLRALDHQTPVPHRNFKPMVIQGGNIPKTFTTKTAKYVQLLYGCRIVPFDTAQNLKVIRDTFTDDGLEGRDCFDRSGLSSNVDIDYDVDKVEVVEVNTAGAPTVWTIQEKNNLITDTSNIKDQTEISAIHAVNKLNE